MQQFIRAALKRLTQLIAQLASVPDCRKVFRIKSFPTMGTDKVVGRGSEGALAPLDFQI